MTYRITIEEYIELGLDLQRKIEVNEDLLPAHLLMDKKREEWEKVLEGLVKQVVIKDGSFHGVKITPYGPVLYSSKFDFQLSNIKPRGIKVMFRYEYVGEIKKTKNSTYSLYNMRVYDEHDFDYVKSVMENNMRLIYNDLQDPMDVITVRKIYDEVLFVGPEIIDMLE